MEKTVSEAYSLSEGTVDIHASRKNDIKKERKRGVRGISDNDGKGMRSRRDQNATGKKERINSKNSTKVQNPFSTITHLGG